MTKRIIFILLLVFVAFYTNAQRNTNAILLEEGFETNWLPTGWENEPLGGSSQLWIRTNGGFSHHPVSAHTGNYNALFYLGGTRGEACNLISPPLDLSGGGYKLEFWHAQEAWQGDQDELYVYYKEGISGTLNLLASYTNSIPNWTRESISIPSTSNEVYIVFKAIQQWGYGVCLDDVKVSFAEPHDLGVTAISPEFVFSGTTVTPQVKIFNFGTNDEATWSLNLTDGNIYNETVSDLSNIAVDSELTVDFPDWTPTDGTYTLTATLTLANDTYLNNNTLAMDVQVGPGNYDPSKIYSFYWGAGSGFVSIDKQDAEYTPLYLPPEYDDFMFICGEYIDGAVYGIDDITLNVYLIRADGHAEQVTTVSGVPVTEDVVGLAYDNQTGILYASTYDDNSHISKLYTVDKSTWVFTEVGNIGNSLFIGIACDNQSNLYGLDIENNIFASIDKTTGAATTIGPTDYDYLDWQYPQDIGGDSETGKIYGVIYDDNRQNSYLGEFNVTTGHFNRIGGIESEFNESSMCAVIPSSSSYVKDTSLININIYPNPSKGKFTIKVKNDFNLEIFNVEGQLIDSKYVTNGYILNLNKPGIYFLKFTNGKNSITKKVIVR